MGSGFGAGTGDGGSGSGGGAGIGAGGIGRGCSGGWAIAVEQQSPIMIAQHRMVRKSRGIIYSVSIPSFPILNESLPCEASKMYCKG